MEKYNEIFKNKNFKPTDKILKGTIEFEINVKNIEETNAYIEALRNQSDIESARYYGIEEYIFTHGASDINYKLYDGVGNLIHDEKTFDKFLKNINKYNL